ncbi:MAG: HAMP domain-containing sensor histidine kinase [Eubacteriales bacterium]|nr:HAMP domain-containing sensor histidine kinase [Eubacteriales bacterium]
MRKAGLSIKKIYYLTGAGVLVTTIMLCAVIVLLFHSVKDILICLFTVAALSVWGFFLVMALQNRISQFTDHVCQTISVMMQGNNNLEEIFDEDTLLNRISYQLYRLYQMLLANKSAIEEQRADLQGMISDISHQLKTPATNLKMAASTLLEQELPRNLQTEYLDSMNTQLDKLEFLMNAMVKSSRLETGVIALEKQQAPVYETLATALGGIFLKAEEKKLKVTVDCSDTLTVPHDSKWTAEALFNILENAVKYTSVGGTIGITVVRWEAYTKIDITDTGRGIPECRHGAIFKRFYREPEVHNTEGIGIGLYLAREIISKQGGYIKVTSAAGSGATFSVFLPNG